MHQPHGRQNVQPVHLVLAVHRHGKEAPGDAKSGVIHQEFQVRRGGNAFFDRFQIRIPREVRRQDFSLHRAARFDGAGLLLQAVTPPRNQHQVVAARGELPGECGSDAARSACNQSQGTHWVHGNQGSS